MAYTESQPTVSLVASSTFANADLYKFVGLTTNGEVVIGATTAAGILGTLLSVTGTTAGAGVETVQVGLLSGVGKVRMPATTEHAGSAIAASSAGLGIAPTTSKTQIGTMVQGSSGTARIGSVLFHRQSEDLAT